MATIACPGCGLPRAEDQIDTRPCPVCDATPVPAMERRPVAKKTAADPTTNLPADVSELDKHVPIKRPPISSIRLTVIVAFLIGAVVGVGGVLGWQSTFPPDAQPNGSPLERPASNLSTSTAPQPITLVEIAPMPHLSGSPDSVPTFVSELVPEPKKDSPALPPVRAIVIHLNQPDATYTIPFPMKKGEHVIIRGKVKALRANGLGAGAILDASDLEVASIFISGKVEGHSNLKLHAPNGVVMIAAHVTGNSRVEINASGGDVRFSLPTTLDFPGSLIDGDASVAITARTVELRGDVNGVQTRVDAIISPGGFLKVAAVQGTATVEYTVGSGSGNAPGVTVGTIGPAATLKRRN